MPDLLTTLLPLATLILGIAGTISTEGLRERRGRKREEENRRRIRQEQKTDRLELFELTNLQEAHTALNHFARTAVRWHLLDIDAAQTTNMEYASYRIGDEDGVAEELRVANRDLSALTQLIIDDDLRSEADEAARAVTAVSHGPKSIEQAELEMNAAAQRIFVVQRKIARRIREIYVEGSIS